MADTGIVKKITQIFLLCILPPASLGAGGYQNGHIKRKHLERGVFLFLFFQLEECFQNYSDDGADDEADNADTLKTEIHGEQGQQRV